VIGGWKIKGGFGGRKTLETAIAGVPLRSFKCRSERRAKSWLQLQLHLAQVAGVVIKQKGGPVAPKRGLGAPTFHFFFFRYIHLNLS